MLKLTFRQKLRILLGRHRRDLILTLFGVLALVLTLWGSHMLFPAAASLLTLVQLAAGSLIVMLVMLLCD